MKPEHRNPPWSVGFPKDFLMDEGNAVERTVRSYFTCEGRYATVHLYHMQFLAHIAGMKPLDLPYFLYKSLMKMVAKARNPRDLEPRSMFHQGLIRILYVHSRQHRVEPVSRPRGGKRRRAVSDEETEKQIASPSDRTRARNK